MCIQSGSLYSYSLKTSFNFFAVVGSFIISSSFAKLLLSIKTLLNITVVPSSCIFVGITAFLAFNGFDGTIENINEEKRKLEVMVKIFGRKTPLELSYMQVEKI